MIKFRQRLLLVLGIAICLLSSIALAEIGSAHVDWDQYVPVSWDLFQGTPPADAHQRTEAAAIHMTISWRASYSVSSSNGGSSWLGQVAAITVTNTMEPGSSWVVPGKAHDNVLNHERLHFDLNEVYRRKLECLLLATNSCQGATQQAAVDQLNASLHQTATVVLQKVSEMQTLYDSQTSHSTNSAEQARWQGLISQWLIEPTTAP
jgi:hypothetical protein